ncbi:response regulator [Paenibacillus sp. GCM10027626]|uniref:response regulator transcription factor n=1 Tax=Paenibacillus sp. GCM10027626 TaxID=3273411 RepID=UPI003641A4F7
MNILLADDESLVRAGLKSMIEELDMAVQVIGETRNGEETVRFVEEHRPDLVFIDIRMPRLNGLEAIARAKAASPDTKWVILSGYSEFQYAKEALLLGASNYLLKPVSLEELRDSLSQICEQHRQQILERSSRLENAFISSLQGRRAGGYEPSHLLGGLHFAGIVCFADHALSPQEANELHRQLLEQLHSLVRSHLLSADAHIFAIAVEEGRLAIVWAWQPRYQPQAAELRQQIAKHLQQWLEAGAKAPYAITAVQLEASSGFEDFMKQLERLHQAAALRAVQPLKGMYALHELLNKANDIHLARICACLDGLCQLYRARDYAGYTKAVALLEKERNGPLLADPAIRQHIGTFLSCTLGISLPMQEPDEKWFKALQAHGDQMLAAAPRTKDDSMPKDLIQQVIAYVDQNYMHDIGMKQIAESFQVTPNYLSSLFHKKHGSTFIKYLTETRMLKAKELLLNNPHLKVAEVAEAVGYYSTRHFTKLFTEHFGCYPSEIRERIES